MYCKTHLTKQSIHVLDVFHGAKRIPIVAFINVVDLSRVLVAGRVGRRCGRVVMIRRWSQDGTVVSMSWVWVSILDPKLSVHVLVMVRSRHCRITIIDFEMLLWFLYSSTTNRTVGGNLLFHPAIHAILVRVVVTTSVGNILSWPSSNQSTKRIKQEKKR